MINWDDTTLAMTMIWTAGELKYDGENEREGSRTRRGVETVETFQNHNLSDFDIGCSLQFVSNCTSLLPRYKFL